MQEKKILIVEDERITAKDLRVRLTDLGYTVCALSWSGKDAIKKARELLPDIVIMDIMLDGSMNGIEAADHIYKEFQIPVIFLTAHSDKNTVDQASKTEAFGYLLKPVRDDDLLTTLEMALKKYESEKKLRASEENYRVLVEGLGQFILKVDSNANLLFVNHAAEDWLQAKQDKLIGKNISDVLHPDIADRIKFLTAQVIQDQIHAAEEVKFESNGKIFWLDLALYPLKEKYHTINAVLIIVRDTTREREIQKALEAAEDRFDRLYNEMPVGIYQTAPDGKLIRVNPTLMQMLGYDTAEELKLQSEIGGYYNQEDRKKFLQRIDEEGKLTGFEVQWKRKDGSPIWVHETARVYKDLAGNVLFFEGIVEDITERKEAEVEIQHRLNFEEVVSNIASKFVRIENLNDTIDQSLQSLGYLSDADRVYLGLFREDTLQVHKFQVWCKKGIQTQEIKYVNRSFQEFPWWKEHLHKREVMNVGAIEDMPISARA